MGSKGDEHRYGQLEDCAIRVVEDCLCQFKIYLEQLGDEPYFIRVNLDALVDIRKTYCFHLKENAQKIFGRNVTVHKMWIEFRDFVATFLGPQQFLEVVFREVSRQKPNMKNNISVGAPIDWEKGLGFWYLRGLRVQESRLKGKGLGLRGQGVECHGVEVYMGQRLMAQFLRAQWENVQLFDG